MDGGLLLVSIWQQLKEIDQRLFIFINGKLASPFLDALLPFLREAYFWAPLYLFIIAFVLVNYSRRGLWWCAFFITTVAITDFLGSHVFKETVQRLRPCNDPLFKDQVRLVVQRCAGGYSFVSNHAANHFGLATFMLFSFKPIFRRWMYFAYVWAFAISFAQIYVGVHYPSDIAGGAALGILAGYLTASLYHHNFGKLNAES